MEMFRIKGVIKNYDWGTKDYLPSLLTTADDGRPQAEYWMGTHPSGEAVTESGEMLSKRIGHRLPYLFKVLSIASPLSLQCHPTKAQGEEGWKREEKARQEGKDVNYKDDNEKAEILSALTPVTALCGFRTFDEIKTSLSSVIPISYGRYLSEFRDIKSLFTSLFSFSADVKNEILTELKRYTEKESLPSFEGEYLTLWGIIRETLDKYEGDIGSVFPLIMNVVHLAPGEALYLEPDTLHAYVKGNGIELMTASDNVLRGGLTKKRIDVPELGRIMYFGPTAARVTDTKICGGAKWYITPSPAFNLANVAAKAEIVLKHDSLLLALGKTAVSSKNETLSLEKGECLYIAPSDEKLSISTSGGAYLATSGYLL